MMEILQILQCQLTLTCSMSALEVLEKVLNIFIVNNKIQSAFFSDIALVFVINLNIFHTIV